MENQKTIEKTNQERKQEIWLTLEPKFKHLKNHCVIEPKGVDDEDQYFHPTFTIEDGVYISCQGDAGNKYLYAFRFTSTNDSIYELPIQDDLLDNIIVSWKQNKEVVLLAFDTLKKVNAHVDKMRSYTTDFINNLLIGNSIEQLSGDFINEIKTATTVISLMQKKQCN